MTTGDLRTTAVLKPVSAWLAFLIGTLIGGEAADPGSLAIAAFAAAGAVWLGYAAASCCRMLPPATNADRFARISWAVAAGLVFGFANLGANWLIANHHPALRALLVQRFAAIRPIEAVLAAPFTEEVLVRLFLMSVIAWIVSRLTARPAVTMWFALIASSLVFALLHLARPFPGDPALVTFYRVSLLVKYTLAGLPMGWLFWRFGLPYAILCHAVVNATHVVLERFVF